MPEQSIYQGLSREDTLQQLLAAIMTLSSALMNSSSGEVQRQIRELVSKDATLQEILQAITTDPVQQTDLLAALTPVARDVSIQALGTSLGAILGKLPQGPALDSTVSSLHADLVALIAKTSGDPATQTTLASALSTSQQVLAKMPTDPATKAAVDAVAAKLSADPATKASVDAVTAKLSADPATQTTSAAILAKLPAAPSLDATTASIATSLNSGTAHNDSAAILAKLPTIPPASAMWRYTASLPTGSTTLRSATSGQRHYVTGLQITNSTTLIAIAGSLLGATITVSIYDGATLIWADVLAAATRSAIFFGRDAPLVGSTNAALTVTTSAPGVMLNLQGYTV